jgi:hypothetical protein
MCQRITAESIYDAYDRINKCNSDNLLLNSSLNA